MRRIVVSEELARKYSIDKLAVPDHVESHFDVLRGSGSEPDMFRVRIENHTKREEHVTHFSLIDVQSAVAVPPKSVQIIARKILDWIERMRDETSTDANVSETWVQDRIDVLVDDIEVLCKQQITDTPESTGRHIGAIHVDAAHVEDILDPDCVDVQGKLRDDGTFDQVRERLQLPESYKIIAIFCELIYRQWNVFVEHDSIPLVKPGEPYPHVELWYQPREDGTIYLADIRSKVIRPVLPLDEAMKLLNIRERR
jgi:hypothetical protein